MTNSFVDVIIVLVNKLLMRQMWSLVTSIEKEDKSCDFNEKAERCIFQRYNTDLLECIIYTLSVIILEV